MRFSKKDNVYIISRITGNQDNILGISFGEGNIEVIEWSFDHCNESKRRTSKEQVLEQVLSGLESVNKALGTSYKLSKIYFSPCDNPANTIYSFLILSLIRHYHNGNQSFSW